MAARVLTHVPLGLLPRVTRAFPGIELIPVPTTGSVPPEARGEVLLTQAWGSPNLAEIVQRGVRWVHAYGTGVNAFPFDALGDRVLTCSRGASAVPIAEWVLAVMLAAEKQLPERWIHEPTKWNIAFLGGLQGKTLGLIGFGGIGQAVAERALAFGMDVIALRRSDTASPIAGVRLARSLDQVLGSADHLVIAAPATPETRGLLDDAAFSLVKPGVHLVNVARGELVDQDALRQALDQKRVGLASLDVVDPEPLPEGHWLYTHPRVRLSPHISWSMPGALDLLIDPFIENLRRYQGGEPLRGRVDPELGY
jgi:phosphoglycerate dehydrogenase-like enzyme